MPRASAGVTPWPPAMIVWGAGYRTAVHRHHCVQLLMVLRGCCLVRSGRHEEWTRWGAGRVRHDVTHGLVSRQHTLVIAFISDERDMGAELSAAIDGYLACVPAHQAARWRAALGT